MPLTNYQTDCGLEDCRICRPGGNFFGINRSAGPRASYYRPRRTATAADFSSPIRGLRWEGAVTDEAQSYASDRVDALLYGMSNFGMTIPVPDTWPVFLANWAAVGIQHERKVTCQPLLSA